MFQLMVKKLWNKKWMMACLLIGNILLIAVASGTPMYTNGVVNRVLIKSFVNYLEENNSYPFSIEGEKIIGSVNEARRFSSSVADIEEIFLTIEDNFQIPLKAKNFNQYVSSNQAVSLHPRSDDMRRKEVKLGSFLDFEEHSNIIAGKMYKDTIEDGVIDVVVSQKTLREEGWILGEEIILYDLKDNGGNEVVIRVTGVFEEKIEEDIYWMKSPNEYGKRYIMDEGLFHTLFVDYNSPEYGVSSQWSVMLDYNMLDSDDVDRVLEQGKEVKEELEVLLGNSMDIPFIQILENYIVQMNKLKTTLYLLQIPVFVLLAIYILMVSKQIMEKEKDEIAVFKSRGASSNQIIRLYVYQSICIAIVSLILGILLGFLFCKIMGNTNSFLVFAERTALKTRLNGQGILFAIIGMLFSLGIILMEAIKSSRASIVEQKRSQKKRKGIPFWKKTYLDVLMLVISLYGWYHYQSNKEQMIQKVLTGAAMDPILFISSILFIIGITLLVLRIYPFFIKLNFYMIRRRGSAPVYTSYKQILNIEQGESFIFLFLVFTIAIGVYNSNVARTISMNEINRIHYLTGADVALQEEWDKTFLIDSATGTYLMKEIERDVTDYEEMEQIQLFTKVFVDTSDNMMVMGIHTKEFGETVHLQEGLISPHWFYSLNAMSGRRDGLLISNNFAQEFGYEEGDTISYNDEKYGVIEGVVCGIVPYWPGYVPVERRMEGDRLIEEEKFLIVTHLSWIQEQWGILPYELWMKVEGSTSFLYDYANSVDKSYVKFLDVKQSVIEKHQDPIFQGTNGILSLGFLIALLLCGIGFLIYWITSIKGRALYFGVCAAMGMSVKDIYRMLLIEQLYLSGVPIAFGFLAGFLASYLYIPFIQLSYLGGDLILPPVVTSHVGDSMRVLFLALIMISIGILILGGLISRLKITQTLKLGED